MSNIKEIRESIDIKLNKLDAQADAFHAALEGSKDHEERIARNKQEARRALDELTAGIAQQKELPDTRKQGISSLVDNLNRQIALIQAASREQAAYARGQIHDGIRKVETEIDTALAESKTTTIGPLRAPIEAYGRAVDKLDAELEAAELRFASVKDKGDAAFDKRRKEMAQEIAKFKQRLAEKGSHAGEKLAKFEAELRGEFEQTVKTIKDRF